VTGAAFAAALVLRPTTSLAILTAGFALILAGGAYVTRWVRAAVVSEFWADERVPVSLPDVGKEVTRLQRLVAKRPDSIELYTALGTAYMEESLFDNAIAVLQQAHARRPANAGVLTALGTAYLNESRLDEAIAAFTPVVRGDSANADARYNLAAAYLVRGVGLADSNVARARADFERVVQLEADSQLVAEARRLIRQLPTAARRPPPLSRP
jgi:cytochrome c-type biogenesis protein CcmH/NrfG